MMRLIEITIIFLLLLRLGMTNNDPKRNTFAIRSAETTEVNGIYPGIIFFEQKQIQIKTNENKIIYKVVVERKAELSAITLWQKDSEFIPMTIMPIDSSCQNHSNYSMRASVNSNLILIRNYWICVFESNDVSHTKLNQIKNCGRLLDKAFPDIQLDMSAEFNISSSYSILLHMTIAAWEYENRHSAIGSMIYNDIIHRIEHSSLAHCDEDIMFDNPLHCSSVAGNIAPKIFVYSASQEIDVDVEEGDEEERRRLHCCLLRTALLRRALSAIRGSVDTIAARKAALLLAGVGTVGVFPPLLAALLAVCETMQTGKSIVPLSWIATTSIANKDVKYTRQYSPIFEHACKQIVSGTRTAVMELLSQTCLSIAVYSTYEVIPAINGNDAASSARTQLTPDAALSLSNTLLSLGAVELSSLLSRSIISSMSGVPARCQLPLSLPQSEWKLDEDYGDDTGVEEGQVLGSDESTCDLEAVEELAQATAEDPEMVDKVITQSGHLRAALHLMRLPLKEPAVRRDQRALAIMLQQWLQVCNPVMLHTSIHSDCNTHNVNVESSPATEGLLEARLLRLLLFGSIGSLLRTCYHQRDCRLPPMEELNSGTLRGLFLEAYQGVPAGSPWTLNDWALPQMYYILLQLASPTWPQDALSFSSKCTTTDNVLERSSTNREDTANVLKKENFVRFNNLSDEGNNHSFEQPIRVGFMSSFFSRHSVGRLLGRVISGLDGRAIEVHILQVVVESTRQSDDLTAALKEVMLHWHILPSMGLVGNTAQLVRSLSLDILVFGDVFMDSFTTHLAMMRMAPVQVAFWGHPHTTGFASIDYFISSVHFHAPAYQRHHGRFSEQLVLFETISTKLWGSDSPPSLTQTQAQAHSHEPVVIRELQDVLKGQLVQGWTNIYGRPFDMSDVLDALECNNVDDIACLESSSAVTMHSCPLFGGTDWRRYGCLQSTMKIHPAFDQAMIKILLNDPCSLVFLLNNPKQSLSQQALRNRLLIAIKTLTNQTVEWPWAIRESVASRIVFVDQLQSEQYSTLVCAMHVNLDPFPFGGGVTLSDSLSCHVPYVTLGHEQTVHRIGEGFAMAMNVSYLVADSIDDYVRKATALATRESGESVSVLERLRVVAHETLFQNNASVKEWETFLLRVARC